MKDNFNKIKDLLKNKGERIQNERGSVGFANIMEGVKLAITINDSELYSLILQGCGVNNDKGFSYIDWSNKATGNKKLLKTTLHQTVCSTIEGVEHHRNFNNSNVVVYSPQEIQKFYKCFRATYNGGLIRNELFVKENTGKGQQEALDYALLCIAGQADTEIAKEIRNNLTTINLKDCKFLENLDGLKNFKSLENIIISECSSIENIDALKGHKNISKLEANRCSSLINIDGLIDSNSIKYLDLTGCESLQNVNGIRNNIKSPTVGVDLYARSLFIKKGQTQSSFWWDKHGWKKILNYNPVDGERFKVHSQNHNQMHNERVAGYGLKIHELHGKKFNFFDTTPFLSFAGCKSLKSLDGISNLTNIDKLDLTDCKSLVNLKALSSLNSITSLNLSSCISLKSLDGISSLTNIDKLDLTDCKSLVNLEALSSLNSITSLNLNSCESLKDFEVIGKLTSLKNIDISCCGYGGCESCSSFKSLVGFEKLSNLTEIDLSSRVNLLDVKSLISCSRLTKLKLTKAKLNSLPKGLGVIPNLSHLDLSSNDFRNLDSLADLNNLASLDLKYNVLQNLDGLSNLKSLKELDLSSCKSLSNLEGLLECVNLTSLNLSGVFYEKKCENLNFLSNCKKLTHLSLYNCESLESVDVFSKLTELTNLNLTGCKNIKSLNSLMNLKSLKTLNLEGCIFLKPRPSNNLRNLYGEDVSAYQDKIKHH